MQLNKYGICHTLSFSCLNGNYVNSKSSTECIPGDFGSSFEAVTQWQIINYGQYAWINAQSTESFTRLNGNFFFDFGMF